jgi:aerobic C4-dicarboxylate transport protein
MSDTTTTLPPPKPRKPFYRQLYIQVLIAVVIGVALGYLSPAYAQKMKPLGDGFIALIKMVIGPIIFCTVVTGIAGMRDMKKVGRVGGKALLYFEMISTVALFSVSSPGTFSIPVPASTWIRPR